MSDFLQLALIAAEAVAAATSAPPRGLSWWRIAGMAGIGLCILIAAGFLMAALWLFLVPMIGAISTALVIAAVALLIATWIALLLRYGRPSPKVEAPTTILSSVPWAELTAAFSDNKASTLLVALLVGIIAGSAGNKRS